jgi:dihydrofolate synthase / folylpolyglutamate synthase
MNGFPGQRPPGSEAEQSYSQAIQFLYSLRLFGTKLGLDNAFKLAALAGDPQVQLRFIHLAGTNGKGSTCAFLESIYRAAGLRVGLFTSPHLVSFRERIQVNRQLITETAVVSLLAKVQRCLRHFPADRHPTFFEVVTLMALLHFQEQNCQVVIWETGLGGRLDATNIVSPLASVITNIQFDHEKWLGHSLAQIASEKAGIIKPGIPILTASEHQEALEVITKTAKALNAPFLGVTLADTARPPLDRVQLPLMGAHQKLNAALAIATVRLLSHQIPVSEQIIQLGLEQVRWPGRFQLTSSPAGGAILLDGAHNPAGAQALRQALENHFPGRRPTLILGLLQDKDWQAIFRILSPLAGRVFLAPVSTDRAVLPADLGAVLKSSDPALELTISPSLAAALEQTQHDPFVVITGSLHLIGEAMEWLGLSPAAAGERTLNEWDAAAATAARQESKSQ